MLGFSDEVILNILAHRVGKDNFDELIIDLSQIKASKQLHSRLIDKILCQVRIHNVEQFLCQRRWSYVGKRIIAGIESLTTVPDLIEIEESRGLGKSLVLDASQTVITRLHGPWFIHAHILELDKKSDFQPRVKAEGDAIKMSHGITSPSLDVLEQVRDYYDCALSEAKVIPNPVPSVVKSQQWQYQPVDIQTILMVGRFDLLKGGDLALDAFRIIAIQNKEVELLFVGPDNGVIVEGKQYSFNEYMAVFIPEAEIKRRINFLGHCEAEKVAKLRRKASVTMMTSRHENFPMSLLEAVATGSPVVATAVGGIKEIITHDFNGLLAEPGSSESIAERVLELLGDAEKSSLLSRNAIEDSKKRFSPDVVAKQTMSFYQSIIARS